MTDEKTQVARVDAVLAKFVDGTSIPEKFRGVPARVAYSSNGIALALPGGAWSYIDGPAGICGSSWRGCVGGKYNHYVLVFVEAARQLGKLTHTEVGAFQDYFHRLRERYERDSKIERVRRDAAALGYHLEKA
jgi:hypothetical protein